MKATKEGSRGSAASYKGKTRKTSKNLSTGFLTPSQKINHGKFVKQAKQQGKRSKSRSESSKGKGESGSRNNSKTRVPKLDSLSGQIEVSTEPPRPKKKILLSMEVITEERGIDSKCSSRLDGDLDRKQAGKQNSAVKVSELKQPNVSPYKANVNNTNINPCDKNDSEKALSFSSGTNLTQHSFDFGFSKIISSQCETEANGDSKKNTLKKDDKGENIKTKTVCQIEGSKDDKNGSKNASKKRNNGVKKTRLSLKDSEMTVPNFIVQPFNSPDLLLPKRNYSNDTKGTLGINIFFGVIFISIM